MVKIDFSYKSKGKTTTEFFENPELSMSRAIASLKKGLGKGASVRITLPHGSSAEEYFLWEVVIVLVTCEVYLLKDRKVLMHGQVYRSLENLEDFQEDFQLWLDWGHKPHIRLKDDWGVIIGFVGVISRFVSEESEDEDSLEDDPTENDWYINAGVYC